MNRIFGFLLCVISFVAVASDNCNVNDYGKGPGKRLTCSNQISANVAYFGPSPLVSIYIFQSNIRQLGKDEFSKYSRNLLALNLQSCNITDIDDDAFRGLTNLEKLSLPSNNISRVKDRWFRELMSLQQLDLSYNQITSIEPAAFQRLPNLRRLDLTQNRLRCLESMVLEPLRGLDKFRFGANPLTFQCRAKLTLWLRDRGVNYKIDPHGPEVWLDQVLWLCAVDDSIPLRDKDEQMDECVILNLFNQLRTVWSPPVPQSIPQQCTEPRKDLTRCLTTNGHRTLTNTTTNGAFARALLLQLRELKSAI